MYMDPRDTQINAPELGIYKTIPTRKSYSERRAQQEVQLPVATAAAERREAPGRQGEPQTNVLFVLGMNVSDVSNISGYRHAGMRNLESFQLSLPNSRQARIIIPTVTERGQLNIIEW